MTKSSETTTTSSESKDSTSTTADEATTTTQLTSFPQPHQPSPTSAVMSLPKTTETSQISTATVSAPTITPTSLTSIGSPPPTATPDHKPRLSTAQVAGASAGSIAVLAIAMAIGIFFIHRRRKRSATNVEPVPLTATPITTYTADRFGNYHPTEWSAQHYGGAVSPPPKSVTEPHGGFAERAFMRRDPDTSTNF
jgi:hypothetical protein